MGAVRCRAVTALQRFQDPFDESDPVTRAYLYHMSCDPSSAVRRFRLFKWETSLIPTDRPDRYFCFFRAAVLNLAKGSRNLLHVMRRLCDVDESVRKAAFLYVSSISVSLLKVRQRVHILKVGSIFLKWFWKNIIFVLIIKQIGLSERSLRVRRVVETVLLPRWLAAYQGNILELLAAVRLDNLQGAKDSATVAKNLLLSLFR